MKVPCVQNLVYDCTYVAPNVHEIAMETASIFHINIKMVKKQLLNVSYNEHCSTRVQWSLLSKYPV